MLSFISSFCVYLFCRSIRLYLFLSIQRLSRSLKEISWWYVLSSKRILRLGSHENFATQFMLMTRLIIVTLGRLSRQSRGIPRPLTPTKPTLRSLLIALPCTSRSRTTMPVLLIASRYGSVCQGTRSHVHVHMLPHTFTPSCTHASAEARVCMGGG